MTLEIKLRRFIARNLGWLIEFLLSIKFRLTRFKNPPIIILSPGKVGSSSVYYTLKKKVENPTYHIHRLSNEGLAKSEKEHKLSDRKSRPFHLIVSKVLKTKLNDYNGPIFLITIIREPISREISAFFQNIDFYQKSLEHENLEIKKDKAREKLKEKLNNNFINELEDWYKEELLNNFSINLFDYPVPVERGYTIVKKGNINLLVLRVERLNQGFGLGVKHLLGLEKFLALESSNIGEKKYYSSSYKQLRDEIKFQPDHLSTILNSKFVQSFYKHDLEKLKELWGK